jgi:hypothetical protein
MGKLDVITTIETEVVLGKAGRHAAIQISKDNK